MGGIIKSFLGGAGEAMAEVGKMSFMQKLQEERDEANHLRQRELQIEGQEFQAGQANLERSYRTSERLEGQDFTSEEADESRKHSTAESDLERKSRESESEADRKNRLKVARISASSKQERAPQKIKYTDEKGFEQEGVLKEKEDGGYIIVKPDNGEPVTNPGFTRTQRKEMADILNVEEGTVDDYIPFNELDPDDPRVTAALAKQRDNPGKTEKTKQSDKKSSTGIVSGKLGSGPDDGSRGTAKDINGQPMSFEEFKKVMIGRYGDSEEVLERIKKSYENADDWK